jgi:Holliday junction resolvasome RuvABC endonuclease subunit
MRILSVDPAYGRSKSASQTGLAYFVDGALVQYGHLLPDEVVRLRSRWLKKTDHLVIEEQFFGVNPKTMKGLVEAKCLWTVAALDRGVPFTELSPQTWQRLVTRTWRFGKGSKKDPTAIESYVRLRWQFKSSTKLSQDELSAIAIGTVFLDMQQTFLDTPHEQ